MNVKLLVFGALFVAVLTVTTSPVFAVEASPTPTIPNSLAKAIGFGLAALGAGYAIGNAGAAGLAAVAEKPEMRTFAIIIVALGEALAIYGLVLLFILPS
ncbi:MAG: ATP synthase subunit C [Thaumarchaeota archaeon]|nr:ATP synthase subunit C [Nitrososphaerota archaeon]